MNRTRAQLVSQLRTQGLCFSEFTLTHEGDYSVADADWNYKDVPHLHWVHELVEATIGYVSDKEIATINMQNILGLTFPMVVFNYQSTPLTQTYFTTFLIFVLIIETGYEKLGPNRTRVNTTYSIGSSKLWRWAHPLIRWTIKRNYKNLMSQDIPMRTRRGQLRSWGYSFYNPASTAPLYSFEETIDVSKSNVIPPKDPSLSFAPVQLSLTQDLAQDGERFIGRDDHLGLRLVRTGSKISIYPRLCPHEGCSLDSKRSDNDRVRCHWHGRLFGPLAVIDLNHRSNQEIQLEYHTVGLADTILTFRPKEPIPTVETR